MFATRSLSFCSLFADFYADSLILCSYFIAGELTCDRKWTVTKSSLAHKAGCKHLEHMRESRHNTAYSIEVQMYALWEILSSDLNATPAAFKSLIFALQQEEPSNRRLNQLRRGMKDALDPGSRNRGGTQDTEDCHEFSHLVRAVRDAGHHVEVFTKVGLEYKDILIDLARAKHERLKKECKKKKRHAPPAFSVQSIKDSDQQVSLSAQFLLSFCSVSAQCLLTFRLTFAGTSQSMRTRNICTRSSSAHQQRSICTNTAGVYLLRIYDTFIARSR